MRPKLANRFFRCPPPFEPASFESLDGTPLAAEVAIRDDRERPGLVVVHGTFGSSGQRIYAEPAIAAYAKWGFNVVALDLRGWGRSATLSDAPLSGGWREAEDVLAAARWLEANSRTTTVGAMGYSLGAAAVLLAATHERAPDLLASGVFSESGFVDARAVLKIALENPGILTREYFTYLIFHYGLRAKMLHGGLVAELLALPPRPFGDGPSRSILGRELRRRGEPLDLAVDVEREVVSLDREQRELEAR